MKTVYNGTYYNGTSSKPNPCSINLDRGAISISILDEFSNTNQIIRWDPDLVSKDDIEISNKIRLKYGSFPFQSLEIQDTELIAALREYYPQHTFAKKDTVSVISRNWKLILLIFIGLIGFGIFSFKVIIPNIAELAATKVPLSVEKSIGNAAYGQITSLSSEDEEKSKLVQEFYEEMNLEGKYKYEINVLNSNTVNAFAVPGGKIAVYNGIINEMDSPDELAALLAHESAHIEMRHSLKSIFRSLSSYFVISLLFGDAGGVTAVVFENIYVFQDLQYSRKMEKEADMYGIQMLEKSGINPKGMVELFNTLEESSENLPTPDKITEFMSTHPLTKHRIEYIQKYLDKNVDRTYKSNPKLDELWKKIKE